MRTVIVGGGILGAALAYRLTTDGVEVELLEAGRLGGGTSAVGTGWFNSGGKEPREYHPLNVSGMAEYATIAREFGRAPWYRPAGVIPEVGREILARAVKYLPGLDGAEIEGARVAYRSIPGDQHPVIGPVPGRPGLYLMVTHSGGTMGPLLGRLSALEIAHGELDARLDKFRPERLVTLVTG